MIRPVYSPCVSFFVAVTKNSTSPVPLVNGVRVSLGNSNPRPSPVMRYRAYGAVGCWTVSVLRFVVPAATAPRRNMSRPTCLEQIVAPLALVAAKRRFEDQQALGTLAEGEADRRVVAPAQIVTEVPDQLPHLPWQILYFLRQQNRIGHKKLSLPPLRLTLYYPLHMYSYFPTPPLEQPCHTY